MKVYKGNKGKSVDLKQQDYLSEGGEGTLYLKNNEVYKIFSDSNLLPPEIKIKELQELNKSNIILPKELIYDENKRYCGFTMDIIPSSYHLSRFMTNGFKKRNNISDDTILNIIKNMKETIEHIHSKGIILVDINENNFMIDENDFETVYFIDVSSYKTKSTKPSAIMPHIRDYRSKDFNEYTDWFSFAIIACQMLIGIHPFKGTHPKYDKNDFQNRIKDCVSVFNKKVKMPSVVRDFSVIPQDYYDWFIRLFEEGKRESPPSEVNNHIIVPVTSQKITPENKATNIHWSLIKQYNENIIDANIINGMTVVKVKDNIFVNDIKYQDDNYNVINYGNNIYFIKRTSSVIQLLDASKNMVSEVEILNNGLYISGDKAFIYKDNSIEQYKIIKLGNKVVMAREKSWKLLDGKSKIFTNVILTSALNQFITAIINENNKIVYSFDLINKNENIVDVFYENGIFIKIVSNNGVNHIKLYRIDDKGSIIEKIDIGDTDLNDINACVLNNGTGLMIYKDNNLTVFKTKHVAKTLSSIEDDTIKTNDNLINMGQKVGVIQNDTLYSISSR